MLVFTGAKRYHLTAMTALSPKLGAVAPPCLPVGLVAEFLENPICLETRTPRLSWRLDDSRTGARQTAYRTAAAPVRARLYASAFGDLAMCVNAVRDADHYNGETCAAPSRRRGAMCSTSARTWSACRGSPCAAVPARQSRSAPPRCSTPTARFFAVGHLSVFGGDKGW